MERKLPRPVTTVEMYLAAVIEQLVGFRKDVQAFTEALKPEESHMISDLIREGYESMDKKPKYQETEDPEPEAEVENVQEPEPLRHGKKVKKKR